MERRELFKKFVKNEIGYTVFEFMRVLMVNRQALMRVGACPEEELDEILLEIQEESMALLKECAEIDEPMKAQEKVICEKLRVRWEGLSCLSDSSARFYLEDIMNKDSMPRPNDSHGFGRYSLIGLSDDDDLPF